MVHHSGVSKRCHTSRFFTDKSLLNQGLRDWRQPHQPHPGTQCSRCGCFLPDLTRFTGNRCGGTDGVTITTFTSRRTAPLYLSETKLQPFGRIKKYEQRQGHEATQKDRTCRSCRRLRSFDPIAPTPHPPCRPPAGSPGG